MDNNSKQLIAKRLRNAEAKELADLASVYRDLEYVVQATIEADKLMANGEKNSLPLQAYWASALMAYRRSFNSGKRQGLKVDVYATLPGDAVKAHEYFYAQADKLIAHSVNPFEEVQVGVVVDDEAVGVVELSSKLMVTNHGGLETLHNLALYSMKFLKQKLEQSRKTVEDSAKAMPKNDLNHLPTIKYTVPPPEDASRELD